MINSDICHASLFTGIGGFDLAAQWVGWKNIFQVEKDKWCRELLSKRFAASKRYEDIKNFSGHEYYGKIDVISGGFPCQPFSVAGKRRGEADDRYLWDEMLRVVQNVKPPWIVVENVGGFSSLGLDKSLSDLENCGYSTETFIIPACAVNARHTRSRIYIAAYSDRERLQRVRAEQNHEGQIGLLGGKDFRWAPVKWPTEPPLCRAGDGVSRRVDRLRGLGNSIVPQVAYEIFSAINLCITSQEGEGL